MRSDNGPPFASKALGGLSRLSVWFIRLGIVPERIEPGHPEQNGRHERMHKTLKAETANPPQRDWLAQQQCFDQFAWIYNQQRPHEGLDMQTPVSCHRTSVRVYPERLPQVHYDSGVTVRRVRSNGQIKWQGRMVYVSEALIGERVAIIESEDEQLELYFSFYRIGIYDHHIHRFVPLKV